MPKRDYPAFQTAKNSKTRKETKMTIFDQGFTEDMALIIVDDLIDCMTGLGLHVTGFGHVDDLLGHLYAKILTCAFKQGIHLEYHF